MRRYRGRHSALTRQGDPAGYPLRLIGMRELRSENSWMHNVPLLMRGDRLQSALMHVDDAADLRINDGDRVKVLPYGEIGFR